MQLIINCQYNLPMNLKLLSHHDWIFCGSLSESRVLAAILTLTFEYSHYTQIIYQNMCLCTCQAHIHVLSRVQRKQIFKLGLSLTILL